jgi:hypothetical protein
LSLSTRMSVLQGQWFMAGMFTPASLVPRMMPSMEDALPSTGCWNKRS